MFLKIYVFQGPGFLGSRFFWFQLQVLEVALNLIVNLNFSLLCHDICLQFFFFFKYQRKKIYTTNLIVALKFLFMSWCLFSEKCL